MKIRLIVVVMTIMFCCYVDIFAMSEKAQEALEVLKSTDTAVRRQAASTLASIRSRETVPALIDALKDDDPGVRQTSAMALGNLRDKRALKPLIKALKDDHNRVRMSALVALGFIRDSSAVKYINDILSKDTDIGVRIQTAQVLGLLKDESSVDPLIEALFDNDKRVKAQAARSLGRIGAESSANPLIEVARNKKEDITVRMYAIEALGQVKTAKTQNTLEKLLESDEKLLAVKAAAALGNQGLDTGLETVLALMDSEDAVLRREAVMAINAIGIKNNRVEEAIRKALSDSDSRVRERAEFTANSLGIELDKKD